MQSETSTPVVKKILIGVTLAIIALVVFLNIGDKENTNINIDMNEQVVYQNTIDISRSYVALRVKTNKLLINASEYSDYATWNTEMTELISNWKNLETKAGLLEKQAKLLSEDKLSFQFVNEAQAFTKSEISNVFDKAPAGRKIRTLAKYLGVDAKMAYKILQNQEVAKADAWNKTGDTFRKLEVAAIVIKDGCKVAAFVGAVAMTGGAAAGATVGSAGVGTALVGGSATIAQTTVLVVTGTDLMLEISEDAATIALGDKHKTVKAISNIREYTDPAASILSLTDIPSSIGKGAKLVDKIGVVLVQVDQVRSMLQDGKLLGINIKPDSTVEVAVLKDNEVEKWIDEHEEIYIPNETNVNTGEGSESEEIKSKINGDRDEEDESEEWIDEHEEIHIPNETNISVGEGSESEEIKSEIKENRNDEEAVENEEKVTTEEAEKIDSENEDKSKEDKTEEPVKAISNSGFTIQKLDCDYTGNWNSNWGAMTFTQSGNSVTATYTHDSGKISATANGNILIGTWSESPSYSSPKDAGDVELELSTDCKTFTGQWRYGSAGGWSGGWTGTKN